MLAALKEAGFGIYMATSKPEGYAVKIAENLGVAEYFDRMFGASFDGKINTKEEVLEYALNTIYGGKYDREVNRDVLMIGDRYFDVRGAAFFGIPTLGVTFGYGSEEELSVNVRVIASSNMNLEKMVSRGEFRADLFGYLIL